MRHIGFKRAFFVPRMNDLALFIVLNYFIIFRLRKLIINIISITMPLKVLLLTTGTTLDHVSFEYVLAVVFDVAKWAFEGSEKHNMQVHKLLKNRMSKAHFAFKKLKRAIASI